MDSSSLQTVKIWRSSLIHLRQYMVPRAQEPSNSLVQMEKVFWLTKKLSWKNGLNTLMVSLIGYHLSMMKLSTDYHRWNVIRYLMSPNHRWNSESNKTPVTWQGSRFRCNTCRDLQSRRSSRCREIERVISHNAEKRCHPSRIQGRINYPPIQTERESWSLWQSSGHLFIVNCWEDPCKSPTEPI